MGSMMSIECSSWPRTSAATTTRSIPARASGSRMAGCLRLRANRRTPLTFGPQAAQARRVHSAWSHRWRVVLLSLVWTFAFVLVDSRSLDAAAQPAVSTPPIVPIDVRLHERVVFTLRTGRAGHTVQERSRAASAALESVLDDPSQGGARIEEQPGTAVVFVGRTPIVTLGDDDAAASGCQTCRRRCSPHRSFGWLRRRRAVRPPWEVGGTSPACRRRNDRCCRSGNRCPPRWPVLPRSCPRRDPSSLASARTCGADKRSRPRRHGLVIGCVGCAAHHGHWRRRPFAVRCRWARRTRTCVHPRTSLRRGGLSPPL